MSIQEILKMRGFDTDSLFREYGRISESLSEYEKCVSEYVSYCGMKPNAHGYISEFWKNSPNFYPKDLQISALFGAVAFGIVTVLCMLLIFVGNGLNVSFDVISTVIVFGVGAFIVVLLMSLILRIIKKKKLVDKLSKAERKIKYIDLVPKYMRNSRDIEKIYFEYVDFGFEDLSFLKPDRKFLDGQYLINIPYVFEDCDFADLSAEKIDSEYLPKYVFSHTKAGVESFSEAIDTLLVSDEIKDSIRKFKSRVEFYSEIGTFDYPCVVMVAECGTYSYGVAEVLTKLMFDNNVVKSNVITSINLDALIVSDENESYARTDAFLEYIEGRCAYIDLGWNGYHDESVVARIVDKLIEYISNGGVLFIRTDGNVVIPENKAIKFVIELEQLTPKEISIVLDRTMDSVSDINEYVMDNYTRIYLDRALAFMCKQSDFDGHFAIERIIERAVRIHQMRYAEGKVPKHKKYVLNVADVGSSLEQEKTYSKYRDSLN